MDAAQQRPVLQFTRKHHPLLSQQGFLHKLGLVASVDVRPQQQQRGLLDRRLHFEKLLGS